MSWTDERVELLKKLWLDGLSASQIAAELSNGITRNAVIGKVHRLGLSGRAKAPAPAAARPRAKAPVRPSGGPVRAGSATSSSASTPRPAMGSGVGSMSSGSSAGGMVRGNVALAMAPQEEAAPVIQKAAEDVVIPMSERVTIMELRESMCRWPLGDPTTAEFRFCGAKSNVGEGPYCTYHARIAYQPAQDRRRASDAARRLQKLA